MKKRYLSYDPEVILSGFFSYYNVVDKNSKIEDRTNVALFELLEYILEMNNIEDYGNKNKLIPECKRRTLQRHFFKAFGIKLGLRFDPKGNLTISVAEDLVHKPIYIDSYLLAGYGISQLNESLYNLLNDFVDIFQFYFNKQFLSKIEKIEKDIEEDITYLNKLGYKVVATGSSHCGLNFTVDKQIKTTDLTEIVNIFKYKYMLPDIEFSKTIANLIFDNFEIPKGVFCEIKINDYFTKYLTMDGFINL